MSDLARIVYTAVATIIGGVVVLVIGQIIIKFLVEPYQEYRKLLSEIVDALTFYANIDAQITEAKDIEEAKRVFRQKASRLRAITYTLPIYRFFSAFALAPSRTNLEKSVGNLIALSNMVYDRQQRSYFDRDKLAKEVSSLLRLQHYK